MSLFLIESAGFEQFTRLGEIRGEPGGSGVSAEGRRIRGWSADGAPRVAAGSNSKFTQSPFCSQRSAGGLLDRRGSRRARAPSLAEPDQPRARVARDTRGLGRTVGELDGRSRKAGLESVFQRGGKIQRWGLHSRHEFAHASREILHKPQPPTAADHSMCRRGFPTDDRLAPNPPGSAAPSAIAHRPQGRYRPVPDPIPSKAPQKDRPEFGSRCSY